MGAYFFLEYFYIGIRVHQKVFEILNILHLKRKTYF